MVYLVNADYAYKKHCGWAALKEAIIKALNGYFLDTIDWNLESKISREILLDCLVVDEEVLERVKSDVCDELLSAGYVFNNFQIKWDENCNLDIVSFDFYPQETIAKLEELNA